VKTDEIREKFLKFFEQRGHVIVPSDSLVPTNDPTLLFTGAGMNQFKDMFLGKGAMPYRRAASAQKCLRTADIENVGRTFGHLTFFEMLGNFSFGDYFKKEAITWGWEFVTQHMGLPPERLVATVYEKDDESYEIWRNAVGLPPEKIRRFDAKENFWPANCPAEGPNGVCGPCSEIHYDNGEEAGCGRPDCGPACKCGRFVEVWNLVFTQFERKDGGVLDPLPQKNIDTGLGLERAAAILQGKKYVLETDIFQPLLAHASKALGVEYQEGSPGGAKIRRIVEHARAVTFCIGDGVLPGNEGRAYVVRRLIRRAVADAWNFGLREPLIHELVPLLVNTMGHVYPEIAERRENIAKIIKGEEERFIDTIEQGWRELQKRINKLKASGAKLMPGEEAFFLADTLGFPLEFTESILKEHGLAVDRERFEAEMERQRSRSKAGSVIADSIFDGGPLSKVKDFAPETEFTGYETLNGDAAVLAVIRDADLVDSVEGGKATLILDRTPFYGEAGGQVGDTGTVEADGLEARITDTKKVEGYILHEVEIVKGRVSKGQAVTARVDADRRNAIRRNHTVTHILHHALRSVLGKHVEQSGSLVAPDRLRFDFTHFSALEPEQLEKAARMVNQLIMRDDPVRTDEMSLKEARAAGAIALFGEKYGETVRVVKIGDYSMECCGGTHVERTGQIGFFKILSEQSVAAGIRRIEAVTGTAALDIVTERDRLLRGVSEFLKTPPDGILGRLHELSRELKDARKEIERLRKGEARETLADVFAAADDVKGTKVVARVMQDTSVDGLRSMADALRKTAPSVAVVLGTVTKGKPVIITALTRDLVERGLHAGEICGEAARKMGGGGGGKPHMAQAGGRNAEALGDAVEAAKQLIASRL